MFCPPSGAKKSISLWTNRMNTESLKTNRLPKTTEQMDRVQNI